MLKRLCLALAGLFALATVAQGAGTVPGFSLTPQFDLHGKIAPGCKLYVIQAGTISTPQNAYWDNGLAYLQTNPMICDAAGRLNQFFVADGLIKLRLTDKDGNQIYIGDNLLVIGASGGGGGGGGSVDPTTVLTTGDIKVAYGTSILSGFVRANGRTIGSSTSGATERANSDAQALFVYLWNADANLAVSGGRGASASADWAANKTIALPDMRGRNIAGLDGMGNTATGRLGSTYFAATSNVLGASGGSEAHVLTIPEMPSHSHTASIFDPGHAHGISGTANAVALNASAPGSQQFFGGSSAIIQLPSALSINPALTGVRVNSSNGLDRTDSTGGGGAFSILSPTMLATFYVKL